MGRFSRLAAAQRQRIDGQPDVPGVHGARAEDPGVFDHVRNRPGLRRHGQIHHVLHDVPNPSRSRRDVLQQRSE